MFYKYIENPDKHICDPFVEKLLESPQKILDKIKSTGNITAIQKGLEEWKNTTPEEAKRKLQDEARKMREREESNAERSKQYQEDHEERIK